MITTPKDYQELLYLIQDYNRQTQAILLPKDEIIYDVDLNTRTIQAPKFLSVQQDHASETIYFKVDRYFDNVDLSQMACVITFTNANPNKLKNGFVYPVPFVDIETFKSENKMLVPWVIEGPATAYSGTVTFSLQFYLVDKVLEDGTSEFDQIYNTGEGFTAAQLAYESHTRFIYNLNLLPSKSEVLYGMGDIIVPASVDEDGNVVGNENYTYEVSTIYEIYQRIEQIEKLNDIYWLVLE